MIRFSAALVVVAIGVLIGGMATSSLMLVYVAIGVSALALVVLAVGVALKRDELFGAGVGSASYVTQARDEQPAGQHAPSAGQQHASAGLQGDPGRYGQQAGLDQVAVAAGVGTFGFSAPDAPPPSAPRAWPPSEPGFPVAPAAAARAPVPESGTFRRPAAPPTRADPVLPWADTLPTRVDVGKAPLPEPVLSWLDDVDDQPAGPSAGRNQPVSSGVPVDSTDSAGSPDVLGADGLDLDVLDTDVLDTDAPAVVVAPDAVAAPVKVITDGWPGLAPDVGVNDAAVADAVVDTAAGEAVHDQAVPGTVGTDAALDGQESANPRWSITAWDFDTTAEPETRAAEADEAPASGATASEGHEPAESNVADTEQASSAPATETQPAPRLRSLRMATLSLWCLRMATLSLRSLRMATLSLVRPRRRLGLMTWPWCRAFRASTTRIAS